MIYVTYGIYKNVIYFIVSSSKKLKIIYIAINREMKLWYFLMVEFFTSVKVIFETPVAYSAEQMNHFTFLTAML